jgi:hypothetical protein
MFLLSDTDSQATDWITVSTDHEPYGKVFAILVRTKCFQVDDSFFVLTIKEILKIAKHYAH